MKCPKCGRTKNLNRSLDWKDLTAWDLCMTCMHRWNERKLIDWNERKLIDPSELKRLIEAAIKKIEAKLDTRGSFNRDHFYGQQTAFEIVRNYISGDPEALRWLAGEEK